MPVPTPRTIPGTAAIGVPLGALALYAAWSTRGLAAQWGVSLAGVALLAAWLVAAMLAVPLARGVPSRRLALLLVVVAVGLRLGATACVAHRLPSGDALRYLQIAANLDAGRGLAIYEPGIGSTMQAFYPPGYPLMLAGWRAVVGASLPSLLILNALIDAAAAAMLYRLAAKLGRPDAGRAAAWLHVIWPSVLLSAPLAQKEGLCALLILGLAIAWLDAIDARHWRTAAPIGVLTGLLALTQPGQAPIALLFGLALLPLASVRRIVVAGLRAVPFAIAVMLPWWLRNWAVFSVFVPLTSAGGVSLWVGNNAEATGNWMPTPPALRGLPELSFARAAGGLAKAWIIENPLAFARLTATKFARACAVGQFGIVRLAAMLPAPSPMLTALLFPLSQGAHLLLLGSSSAALTWGRRVPLALILLLFACGAQLLVFGVWFEFGERHREFATPFLLLLFACVSRLTASADG